MIPVEGTTIKTHGQIAVITQIIKLKNKIRIYLDRPIVVPEIVYTRDYIEASEIQEYLHM